MTQGYDNYLARICPCGCGQHRDDCLDPNTDGRWQVEPETCYARVALDGWAKVNEPGPGVLVGVRLLPEGETASDLLEFDPERAAAEYAAHQERFGITDD